MIAVSPLAVLEQTLAWAVSGDAVVLVTLIGVEGSTSRGLGTQMAVTASGQHVGSFSGGCIDAAIISEAQAALASGTGRTVRFGLGSPYIDVRLPCGGGIDLMFTPQPDADILRAAVTALYARESVTVRITPSQLAYGGMGFELSLYPPLRIVTFGQGEDLSAFLQLAHAFGARTESFTPDAHQAALLAKSGIEVQSIAHPGDVPDLRGDTWTAFTFLFHDRDWEDALLPQVLKLPSLFCGAVGSPRTHAARLERLKVGGIDNAALSRLRGPIGLIPATRDPATLAISILAEIAAEYAAACRVSLRNSALAD